MRGEAPALAALVAAAAIAAIASPLHLRSWRSFDLVALAQDEVRHRLPPDGAPVFLDQPDGRTDVHGTGRQDLRAVCGWMTTRAGDQEPRFFYVLMQLGLLGVSTDEVFIQSQPLELSPKGGESWCKSPPLSA